MIRVMKRDVPAPVNGSTDLVPVKAYVDVETQQAVNDRAAACGWSTSKYLGMLLERDLKCSAEDAARGTVPYPAHRTEVVKALVEVALWRRAAARAQQLGRSLSKYLLELILQDPLDADGRPQWASLLSRPEPLPGLEAA